MLTLSLSARRAFRVVALLVFLLITLPSSGSIAGQVFRTTAHASEFFGVQKWKASCCANSKAGLAITTVVPEYETYKLVGTYYTLNENLTATLMLNNKGPAPILATPTFYSLAGTRLDLAAITVPAASFTEVEMHSLLAGQAEEFREGSLKIAYQGGDYQLGAQIKLTDPQRKLIWAEQLVYTSKFTSSRLENVWWLPSEDAKAKVVVSNTSSSTITATFKVDGTSPGQTTPYQITLLPWESRVLNIMRDLVGDETGKLDRKGGISIQHNGNPGAILARMYIARPSKGYSATAGFIDPESTASARWHGNGFRFRNLDGSIVESSIAVRNSGTRLSRVKGRIIYTKPNHELGVINLTEKQIAPAATKVFDLDSLIADSDVPASVQVGGIEIEYDTLRGTIVTSVQSMSSNGQHVFQVPMSDPQKLPSSAGGFPWKTDGDYRTLVYIKNETAAARRYAVSLVYPGGGYTLPPSEIRAGETVVIDFKKLRDEQVPDSVGNLIPLSLEKAQIGWSARGGQNNVLSARSEQISVSEGVASTYSCYNCCSDVFVTGWIEPYAATIGIGSNLQYAGKEIYANCYFQEYSPNLVWGVSWLSYNSSIAIIDSFGGEAEGINTGDTWIEGSWTADQWTGVNGYCQYAPVPVAPSEPVEVVTVTITKADGSSLSSPFRLGKTGTGSSPINRKQSLKATVDPAEEAPNVTVEVSGKITLSNLQRNGAQITFDVVGNDASTSAGDQVILAKRSGVLLTHAPVSVVIPKKIATPHDTTGSYVAANRVLDATTSPAILGLPSGQVSLYTIYVRFLTITVKDQFDALIGDIYSGALITETSGGTDVSINQTLTSSSTYSDPVGLGIFHSNVTAGSTAAQNWPSQALQPMVSTSASQNIAVQVDGFSLSPAISNRTWTTTAPNTLTITWP